MDRQTTSPLREYGMLIDIIRERTHYQTGQVGYTFLSDGETEAGSPAYGELDQRAHIVLLQNSLGQSGERVRLFYPPEPEYTSAFWGYLYTRGDGAHE